LFICGYSYRWNHYGLDSLMAIPLLVGHSWYGKDRTRLCPSCRDYGEHQQGLLDTFYRLEIYSPLYRRLVFLRMLLDCSDNTQHYA